jgi:hypothetical protein
MPKLDGIFPPGADDHAGSDVADLLSWLENTGMPRDAFFALAHEKALAAAACIRTMRAERDAHAAKAKQLTEQLEHARMDANAAWEAQQTSVKNGQVLYAQKRALEARIAALPAASSPDLPVSREAQTDPPEGPDCP